MTQIHHPDECRLGKLDAKPPHAMLHDFVDFEKAAATIEVPANIINSSSSDGGPAEAVQLAMYLNDREGDCTCAGIGNTLRVNSNGQTEISDDDVQGVYVAVTGQEGAAFDPATGENDNGCAELDVLDHVTANPIEGVDEVLGHAGIDMTNDSEYRMSLYLGGSIYAGAQLSTDQQSQQIWGPGPADPGSWGGHCPPICDDYTQIPHGLVIGGVPIPASLGRVFSMLTWATYKPCLGGPAGYIPFAVDEGHFLITRPWIAKVVALGILDESGLKAYLKTLRPER